MTHAVYRPRSPAIRVLLFFFAAVLGATLGCNTPQSTGSSEKAPPAAPPAAVRIGYFANATHAQAVLGVASGDLARAVAPSKLETRIFNAGPSLIEALFAGEVDIGYVGPGPALSAHAKSHGKGLRVIAGAAANGVSLVARAGSGIESLADLKGKRIATPQLGNTQDIAARHYLMTALGQTDASNIVPIANAEQVGLMSRGEIDAAWAPEPWGQRLIAEAGAKLVAEEKDLWPSKEFVLTLVVASPEFLAAHADVVEKVLAVHHELTDRLAQNPDKELPALGDALFALTSKKLPDGVLPAALRRVKFTDDPHEDTLRTMAAWTHDLGFERETIDITGLVDTSLLDRTRGKK